MKEYTIKRHVVEELRVYADTEKEALEVGMTDLEKEVSNAEIIRESVFVTNCRECKPRVREIIPAEETCEDLLNTEKSDIVALFNHVKNWGYKEGDYYYYVTHEELVKNNYLKEKIFKSDKASNCNVFIIKEAYEPCENVAKVEIFENGVGYIKVKADFFEKPYRLHGYLTYSAYPKERENEAVL